MNKTLRHIFIGPSPNIFYLYEPHHHFSLTHLKLRAMPPPVNLGIIPGNTFCFLFRVLVVMNSPGLFPFTSQILDKQPHHFSSYPLPH